MIDDRERAERFKMARTVLNVNGKQGLKTVYDATGVSQSMISDLETYTMNHPARPVQYQKILTLANHYGVNVAWLLGQSDSPSLNEDVQNTTRVTGLSDDVIQRLQNLKQTKLIDSLNLLLKSDCFIKMLKAFDTARTINMNSTETEETASLIDHLTQWGIDDGMDTKSNRVSDHQLIDMYLWKASQEAGNAFRQIMMDDKGGDNNGER